MYGFVMVLLIVAESILPAFQNSSSDYVRGTITAVVKHENAPAEHPSDVSQYDVSIKVGNTVYVVLYTPPNGANSVEYVAGIDLLVLVGESTLTFNSKLSGTTEVPILRRQLLAEDTSSVWSKSPGEYFSTKLQHLSESLQLSRDQEKQIRPILEQESAEVGQIWANPVLTRKDKLNRYEKIVQSSDKKLKPILTPDQLQKLLEMRKEQKEELKKLNAEQKGKQAESS